MLERIHVLYKLTHHEVILFSYLIPLITFEIMVVDGNSQFGVPLACAGAPGQWPFVNISSEIQFLIRFSTSFHRRIFSLDTFWVNWSTSNVYHYRLTIGYKLGCSFLSSLFLRLTRKSIPSGRTKEYKRVLFFDSQIFTFSKSRKAPAFHPKYFDFKRRNFLHWFVMNFSFDWLILFCYFIL